MISEKEKIIIKSYLDSTDEEIIRSISRMLITQYNTDYAAVDDEEIKNVWERYIKEKVNLIKQKICIDWNYKEKIKEEKFRDDITLVASIADVIAGVIGILPPVMIAALLVKKGLDKLCLE